MNLILRYSSPLTLFLLFLLSEVALAPLPAAAGPMLVVDRASARLRADATVQSRQLGTLNQGQEVEQLRRHNEWVQVGLKDGSAGWVHSALLQARLLVKGQGVRVRSAASAASESVTMVYRGQELGELARSGDWVQIRLDDGTEGWVNEGFLRAKTAADARSQLPSGDVTTPETEAVTVIARPVTAEGEEDDATAGRLSLPVERNPFATGLQLEASQDYRGALDSFEEVLIFDPGHRKALRHAARAHRQLDEYDEALVKLYRILDLEAESGQGVDKDAFLIMAEVYRLIEEPDSARHYQALYRGDVPSEPPPAEEDDVFDDDETGDPFPWFQVALALGGSGLLVVLVTFLLVNRKGRKAGGGWREGSDQERQEGLVFQHRRGREPGRQSGQGHQRGGAGAGSSDRRQVARAAAERPDFCLFLNLGTAWGLIRGGKSRTAAGPTGRASQGARHAGRARAALRRHRAFAEYEDRRYDGGTAPSAPKSAEGMKTKERGEGEG